jgi:hypothetical protein
MTLLEAWMPENLAELRQAVDEMISMTYEAGHNPETVYVCVRDLRLQESTLTDGSKALDLKVRENK